MAGGPVLSTTDKTYGAKMTGYAWFVCVLGGCAGLLLGYDNGVIGGVTAMPAFQKKFFPGVYSKTQEVQEGPQNPYCKYNDHILQLVVSSLYISALFCSLAASPFARMFGRKLVLLISGLSFFVGAAIQAGADNVAMLIIGRVLLGVGVGAGSLVIPMYNAEVAPPHMRGAMNIMFQLFVTIGIFAAGLINYGADYIDTWGWRLSLGLAAVPAVLVIIGGIILPESPNSLLERGHFEKGRKVLETIRGTKDVQEEFDDIMEAARQSNLIKHPLKNLFKPQYRPQLIISFLFMMFQQFTGINAIVFYAPVFFSSIGSGHTAALLNTVIIGAVNVLSTVVAIIFVDKVGRKFLLIVGAIQMIITEFLMGVLVKVMFDKYGDSLPSPASWGLLVVICVYVAGFAWSWGPIGWLYPTEIQPLETRSAGASINTAMNMLFTFVIGQCFVTMLCTMEYGVFFFFGGMVVIMMLWAIFFLVETQNVPIEGVFRLFSKHWFWGKHSKIGEVHMAIPEHMRADVDSKGDVDAAKH